MPTFTDRVPYLGFVNWTDDHVRDYAHILAEAHVPKRRWFVVGPQYCRACSTTWICFAAQWARGTINKPEPNHGDLRRDITAALLATVVGMLVFVAVVILL